MSQQTIPTPINTTVVISSVLLKDVYAICPNINELNKKAETHIIMIDKGEGDVEYRTYQPIMVIGDILAFIDMDLNEV